MASSTPSLPARDWYLVTDGGQTQVDEYATFGLQTQRYESGTYGVGEDTSVLYIYKPTDLASLDAAVLDGIETIFIKDSGAITGGAFAGAIQGDGGISGGDFAGATFENFGGRITGGKFGAWELSEGVITITASVDWSEKIPASINI